MISEAKISSGVLDFVSLVVYWFPERFLLKQGLMLTVLSLFYRSPIDVVLGVWQIWIGFLYSYD